MRQCYSVGTKESPYGNSMKNTWQGLAQELEDAKAAALYRSLRIAEPDSPALNFADNDYLGLRFHPRVVAAFQKAAEKYGTGSGASRLITGTTEIHERLEKKIAVFKRREKALMYGSGYLANLGIVSALAGEKDLVIIDKLNHASIIDACRLSGAELRVYPHKNLKKLEAILKTSARFRRKLIITDSVFSMDGDLAPLPELVSIKKKSGALLMIDEAHGTGVFGENGRGAAEHFGVEEEIDISMGTLSKAVGCLGGYAAGPAVLIDYLINFSRPFIFATAPPAAMAAACLESFRVMEEEPELRRKLWQNVKLARKEISGLGYETGETESPIIPLLIGNEEKALNLSVRLREKGILIPAIRYPTVSKGKARLRLTLSARHSAQDLNSLFTAMRQVRELL